MSRLTSDQGDSRIPRSYTWLLGVPSLLLVLVLAGLLARHSLTDLDIWFHLRAGRDLLAGQGFPHVNTYSFSSPDFPWLNHEWLFQVLTVWTGPAGSLAAGSALGWNVLRLGLILALVAVLLLGDGNLDRLRNGAHPMAPAMTGLVTLAGLLLLWPRFNLRPELISYLFLVLLVREVDHYYQRPAPSAVWSDHRLWRLGALVLAWAQCHGFAAIGPVVILIRIVTWPAEQALGADREKDDNWPWQAVWAPLLISLAALVLTPNLWRGLLFPVRALGQFTAGSANLSHTVSELVPLLATRNSLDVTLVAFKVSLVWAVVFSVLAWGRVSLLRLVLVASTTVAALANQRNIALYGLAFILLHTGCLDGWPAPWWRHRLRWPRLSARARHGLALAATVTVAVGAVWWAVQVVNDNFYLAEGVGRRFGDGWTPATYPSQAAGALRPGQGARTFANLDAAAYLLGTTEAKLFVDGRTEAFPARGLAEYAAIKKGDPTALNSLGRTRVSAVVLALASGAFDELALSLYASPAWQVAAAGPGGVLILPAGGNRQDTSRQVLLQAAEAALAETAVSPARRGDLCLAASGLQQLAGDTAGARRSLQQGLAARPDHPNLNHNLGNILMAEGQFAAAGEHFARALHRNRRLAGSALNLGVCQLRLSQPEAAVRSFRRSLAIDGKQVAGWVNLAVALRGTGESEAAVRALSRAVDLKPGDGRLRRQLQEWRRNLP